MAIMDEEVGTKGRGSKVVNTTRTIGDITKDEAVGDGGEGGKDIREDERIHEEAFRQLEG